MLVQHLLTERLFRTIFNNPEFVKRNAIAREVERVIDALVSQSFRPHRVSLKSLDRFYLAIEGAARLLPDFSEKQHFLNTVYERFFQGYSVKLADTQGIVYTPQEIVNFMCASVAEVLKRNFGKSSGSPDVNIHRPLHRHRQFHREPAAPHARSRELAPTCTASNFSPTK